MKLGRNLLLVDGKRKQFGGDGESADNELRGN